MSDTIYRYNQQLRCGYTTGTCAAAATKASALMLLSQNKIDKIEYRLQNGESAIFLLVDINIQENSVYCAIEKYSGDDPDATSGILIYSQVSKTESDIFIDGGVGIGRVTKSGLDQPIGNAAINTVPRQEIAKVAREICEENEYCKGLKIIISAPKGEEIAKKTMNSQLGIIGGISILGTSGVVRPMSEEALKATIALDIKMKRQESSILVITPGNYGEVFTKKELNIDEKYIAIASNFIGSAIDYCVEKSCSAILLVGHIGKFVKLGAGIMNTHSHDADGRMEILVTCALKSGADIYTLKEIANATTTDDAVDILKAKGLLEKTMNILMERIAFYINKRSGKMKIGAIVFSNKEGILGTTENAEEILKELK